MTRHIFFFRVLAATVIVTLVCNEAVAAEINTTLVVLRFIERYIVACAGVTLLYFGYRLFSSAQTPGDLKAEWSSRLKLQLTQVGPGVFFALFGTVLLMYVLSSRVNVTTGPIDVMLSGATPVVQLEDKQAERAIRALEIVSNFSLTGVYPSTDKAKVDFQDALEVVHMLQAQLVDSLVADRAYADFRFAMEQLKQHPNYLETLSPELRERIEKVERLIEGEE